MVSFLNTAYVEREIMRGGNLFLALLYRIHPSKRHHLDANEQGICFYVRARAHPCLIAQRAREYESVRVFLPGDEPPEKAIRMKLGHFLGGV